MRKRLLLLIALLLLPLLAQAANPEPRPRVRDLAAAAGPVEEGSVGAGTGTMAFGWKRGSAPPRLGGWTVGALVQSNFGGVLRDEPEPKKKIN